MALREVGYQELAQMLFSDIERVDFYNNKNPITNEGEEAYCLKVTCIADDTTVIGNYYGGGSPFVYDMTRDENPSDLANALKEWFEIDGMGETVYIDCEKLPLYLNTNISRIEIVMKALNVKKEDALKIVRHLERNGCANWIDNYKEGNRSPLIDVHYESDFEDMINWQYDDAKPSEMIGMSNDIKDYPEMLELDDKIIYWYGLV